MPPPVPREDIVRIKIEIRDDYLANLIAESSPATLDISTNVVDLTGDSPDFTTTIVTVGSPSTHSDSSTAATFSNSATSTAVSALRDETIRIETEIRDDFLPNLAATVNNSFASANVVDFTLDDDDNHPVALIAQRQEIVRVKTESAKDYFNRPAAPINPPATLNRTAQVSEYSYTQENNISANSHSTLAVANPGTSVLSPTTILSGSPAARRDEVVRIKIEIRDDDLASLTNTSANLYTPTGTLPNISTAVVISLTGDDDNTPIRRESIVRAKTEIRDEYLANLAPVGHPANIGRPSGIVSRPFTVARSSSNSVASPVLTLPTSSPTAARREEPIGIKTEPRNGYFKRVATVIQPPSNPYCLPVVTVATPVSRREDILRIKTEIRDDYLANLSGTVTGSSAKNATALSNPTVHRLSVTPANYVLDNSCPGPQEYGFSAIHGHTVAASSTSTPINPHAPREDIKPANCSNDLKNLAASLSNSSTTLYTPGKTAANHVTTQVATSTIVRPTHYLAKLASNLINPNATLYKHNLKPTVSKPIAAMLSKPDTAKPTTATASESIVALTDSRTLTVNIAQVKTETRGDYFKKTATLINPPGDHSYPVLQEHDLSAHPEDISLPNTIPKTRAARRKRVSELTNSAAEPVAKKSRVSRRKVDAEVNQIPRRPRATQKNVAPVESDIDEMPELAIDGPRVPRQKVIPAKVELTVPALVVQETPPPSTRKKSIRVKPEPTIAPLPTRVNPSRAARFKLITSRPNEPRSKKALVQQPVPVKPSVPVAPLPPEIPQAKPKGFRLTKEHMAQLHAYVFHGMTLPTVSRQSPYKGMCMDTTRFDMVLQPRIAGVVSKLRPIFLCIITPDGSIVNVKDEEGQKQPAVVVDLDRFLVLALIVEVKSIIDGLQDFVSGSMDALDKLENQRRKSTNTKILSPERRDLFHKLKNVIPVLGIMRDVFQSIAVVLNSIISDKNFHSSKLFLFQSNVKLVQDCAAAAYAVHAFVT